MKILSYILLSTCLVLSPLVNAGGSLENLTISKIATGPYTYDGAIKVTWGILSVPHNNPDSCTHADTILIRDDNSAYNEMVSMLLSAQARNTTINAYEYDCKEIFSGSGTYPLVYNMSIN